jgi:hypothetical protein
MAQVFDDLRPDHNADEHFDETESKGERALTEDNEGCPKRAERQARQSRRENECCHAENFEAHPILLI